jgi:hypothetical protein
VQAAQRSARGRTLFSDFDRALERAEGDVRGRLWPSSYYATRPAEYCREILGVELWSFQLQVLDNILHSRHSMTAGGRKIGKDFVLACALLWFWASFPRALVIMYAPTAKHIDEVLWEEVKNLWREHGVCLACRKRGASEGIEIARPCEHSALMVGTIGISCEVGLRSEDGRRAFGMVANPAGGSLRGPSAEYFLAIIDEACIVSDAHHQVIAGNLASANAKLTGACNPTTTSGFAWRAFHSEGPIYRRDDGKSSALRCSSASNPNIADGANIPGLASKEWLEARALAWTRGSRIWNSEVEGIFPEAEKGQLFPLNFIQSREQAHAEWVRAGSVAVGRLSIGVDVAGSAKSGDYTAITVLRGTHVLCDVWTKQDCTPDDTLQQVLIFIGMYRQPGDFDQNRPRVNIDADGEHGGHVFARFKAYASDNFGTMLVTGFHGALRIKYGTTVDQEFYLTRDLLFGRLLQWAKDGGCWPENLKIRSQLDALRWLDNEGGTHGNKTRLVPKDELIKILGSSPDELDSMALACWLSGKDAAMPGVEPEAAGAAPDDGYQWHEPASPYDSDITDPRNRLTLD